MKIDDKIKNENYNTTLTEKQQIYLPYCEVKLMNVKILQAKKYYLSFKSKLQKKLGLLFSFRKSFKKNKIKTTEDASKKQTKAVEDQIINTD